MDIPKKKYLRNRKGNLTVPHSTVAVTHPHSTWGWGWGSMQDSEVWKSIFNFLLVSFLPNLLNLLLQGADPQDLVLCHSWSLKRESAPK